MIWLIGISRTRKGVSWQLFCRILQSLGDDIFLLDGRGLQLLLVAATELAKTSGATAIEGFPYVGSKRRSRDTQVGFESIFSAAGFQILRVPSANRLIMRKVFDS